jgi:hypothetical protein
MSRRCTRVPAAACWRQSCTFAALAAKGAKVATALYPARRRWRSRRHSILWSLSTVALLVFSAVLASITREEFSRLTRVHPPTPPEVTRDLVVRNVADLMGRRASFRVLLFTDEFRWRLSSSESLENGSGQPVFTQEMKAVLNDADEIICVGASSEEIPSGVPFEEGRASEERRAGRRAEQIAMWVRAAVSKPIPVRKLNVGHHTPTGQNGDTSDQRRVVIILVLDRDEGTNVDEALRTAMARESLRAPIFDTLLTQYSLASRPGFAWVP